MAPSLQIFRYRLLLPYILADGVKFMNQPADAHHDSSHDSMTSARLPSRWQRGSSERRAAACMLKRIRAGLDRRTRKVRRVRAAIRVGVYENDLKLHIAIDRMLGDVAM
jgi:hypothetical protein